MAVTQLLHPNRVLPNNRRMLRIQHEALRLDAKEFMQPLLEVCQYRIGHCAVLRQRVAKHL